MLAPLLELDDDSSDLSHAFLLWLALVGLLWYLSVRVQRRDEAARAIHGEARPQVEAVRRQVQGRRQRAEGEEGGQSPAVRSPREGAAAASGAAAGSSSAAAPNAAAAASAGSGPAVAPAREDCPICLDTVKYPVSTNCSHVYCCGCFLQYHDQSGGVGRGMVKCPCCRRPVDVVLPAEPGWTRAEKECEEGRRLAREIETYNARYSSAPRAWQDVARDTPHYLRRMWTELSQGGMGSFQLMQTARIWLIIGGTLLYFLSPFDLIPDSLFGLLGMLDDVMVVLAGLVMVGGVFRNIQIAQIHQMQM